MKLRFIKLKLLIVCAIAVSNYVYAQPREIARTGSPNKKVDVVVIEGKVGATASTPYEVFLVSAGKSPAQTDLILKVDKSAVPRAEWTDTNAVLLRCDGGRVWHFQNFGSIAVASNEFLSIGISLDCGKHGYIDN